MGSSNASNSLSLRQAQQSHACQNVRTSQPSSRVASTGHEYVLNRTPCFPPYLIMFEIRDCVPETRGLGPYKSRSPSGLFAWHASLSVVLADA